ncbi:phytanoyl-CoA dioxygenase family protein [Cyclobacterium amurskyense]|uniref:Phytanoyl-CoA dioxygenase n=1 Tax=Cyclobacterium amurskyense TaxID=320787 RepID=A0A0H4P8Y8_9BACT|nr:phytanoyl-CoA dioxygenase family protein [Cyclobacterium amurskyense]AKP49590.1 Phytanoyl-CoA dioxygenase [Cyclobacterium amurskyense]
MKKQKSKKQFDQDGYLYFPGFLDKIETNQIKSRLDKIVEEGLQDIPTGHIKFENTENKQGVKMIQDLHLYDPLFKNILFESKFSALAAELLGEKVVGKTVEFFNKPAKIGKATPPHQDGYYFMLNPMSAVTFWISLEEVDKDNGWVSYVKGSHLNGVRTHRKSGTIGFSQEIVDFGTPSDLENEEFIATNPGDVLVHHALTIHRAAPNTSINRSRKALGLIYFGESAKEDLIAKKAYIASLNK